MTECSPCLYGEIAAGRHLPLRQRDPHRSIHDSRVLAVNGAQGDGGHILLGRLGEAEDGGGGPTTQREAGQAGPEAAHLY